jgi:hypothetical protein
MGSMSASDAAPLPRAGEVFFDVRGGSRTMRVSWYADTGIAVFSIWQGGTCTGTFRLPIPELPRMIDALSHGPTGGVGPLPDSTQSGQAGFDGPQAGFPAAQAPPTTVQAAGPPTAAMAPAVGYAGAPEQDYAQLAQPPGHPDPRFGGYADAGPGGYGEAQQAPGYGAGPQGAHQDLPHGYADAPHGYADVPQGYGDVPHGYEDTSAGYQDGPYAPAGAPAEGYQDAAPGGGYGAPGAGYPDPPPQPGQAAQAPFSGGQGVPRTPTGPLPVGRWHEDEYAGGYPDAGPAGGGYGGADQGYQPGPGYRDYQPEPGYQGGQGYQADPGYQGGQEYLAGQDYQVGPAGDEIADDPLGGDYGGEAEQGYLPGPPTETFRPVAVGSHSREAGQHGGRQASAHQPDAYQPDAYQPAGYEPAGDEHGVHTAEGSEHSPYTRPGDSPPESLVYHPGHAGTADREYRPSRGRS